AERLVAQGELGRAEGLSEGVIDTATKAYMAFPAVAMTSGDVTARQILEKSGIPEKMAREFTLTSEPATALGRSIANWGRGQPKNNFDAAMKALANTVLPFKRTPANIMEQGLLRMGGR